MRDFFFNKSMTKLPVSLLVAAAIAALAACSDNTPIVDPTAPPPPPVPAVIALGTSANWIPTDNATAATLTATLVDSSNAVMPGVAISFSTTSGNLNTPTVTTDAAGQATVTLKSGLSDYSNRTAIVTAAVGAQSASLPILIKGSGVALGLTPSNTIQVGVGTIAASATVTNSTGLGLPNQTVRFSIGATSTGAATLSAATLLTDAQGATPALTVTPTAAGTVVLTAEWLNSTGAVTATTTIDIIVTAASGTAFAIITPASNPVALSSGATQLLAATVPATIAGVAVAKVRISATSGTWVGITQVTPPGTSIMQTPTAGAVAATYTAPSNSGSMTIQVDALDAAGVILSSLSRTFAISAPAAAAAKVFLSPFVSTIVPSSGGNLSISTLVANVRDATNNAVGGAAVMFGLLGTTGSGESVSPAVAITDSTGRATTTFTAGSAPTLAEIYAQASVVGEICTFVPNPLVAETNAKCDAAPMIVAATAVSVIVGFGTTVADTANTTQYKLPGSVLVVDANGSAVAGATVTLTLFPIEYINGTIYLGQGLSQSGTTTSPQCLGTMFSIARIPVPYVPAEDVNRNGIMDPGEDVNGNGVLSPPQAAGGAVPMSVTTDSTGAATFYLQYPKSSAWFINDELTARVIVLGTESMSKTLINPLPMSVTDAYDPNCALARTATY